MVLGPAMRADLIIDMDGKPGQSYGVIDDFYEDLAYKLLDLAYAPRAQPETTQTRHRSCRPTHCRSLTLPPPSATRSPCRAG